jgi:hypothetical protein
LNETINETEADFMTETFACPWHYFVTPVIAVVFDLASVLLRKI